MLPFPHFLYFNAREFVNSFSFWICTVYESSFLVPLFLPFPHSNSILPPAFGRRGETFHIFLKAKYVYTYYQLKPCKAWREIGGRWNYSAANIRGRVEARLSLNGLSAPRYLNPGIFNNCPTPVNFAYHYRVTRSS